jgi:hypothetical protein
MSWLKKHKFILNCLTVVLSFSFAFSGFCADLNSARIIPKGTVSIYKGDQKVGEFKKEAPLPENSLLSCEGRCGVKMTNLYAVAEDQSLFTIRTNTQSRELLVKKGTLYFAWSNSPQSLMFNTPDGVVETRTILLKASSNAGVLKGYVAVKPTGSEIGVIEGGTMVLSTPEGDKRIEPGQQLTLAKAGQNLGNPDAAPANGAMGAMSNTALYILSASAVLVTAGIIALAVGSSGGGGGGHGGGGSPAAPEPE